MLIKLLLKNKTKEELINMYNDKKNDENYKILLEKEKKKKMKKKIFSKFDKCTIFWFSKLFFIFFIQRNILYIHHYIFWNNIVFWIMELLYFLLINKLF